MKELHKGGVFLPDFLQDLWDFFLIQLAYFGHSFIQELFMSASCVLRIVLGREMNNT